MTGMAIAMVTTLARHRRRLTGFAGSWSSPDRDRRRHRRGHRAPHPDDGDAGARRRVPFAGRHGGGAGRGRAFYAPEAFGIGTPAPSTPSLIEMSLGVAIGAVTFTGSVIAFLKLRAHVGQADPSAGASRHQHRARACCSYSASRSCSAARAGGLLGDRARCPSCSAFSSSSRSAAPTCRS